MNRNIVGLACLLLFVLLASALVGILGSDVPASTPAASAQTGQGPSPIELHEATAIPRGVALDADAQLEIDIIENGLESGKAGFHLVRPMCDPYWSAMYGLNTPSGGFWWCDAPVYYPNIEYQRFLPVEMDPSPIFSDYACVSQARVFQNALGTYSVLSEVGGSTYCVAAQFASRSLSILSAMLQPKDPDSAQGYIDWFQIERPLGQESTEMKVVVASDNKLYVPFSIQELLATGTTPVQVIIATGLTQSQATVLASRLNVE